MLNLIMNGSTMAGMKKMPFLGGSMFENSLFNFLILLVSVYLFIDSKGFLYFHANLHCQFVKDFLKPKLFEFLPILLAQVFL